MRAIAGICLFVAAAGCSDAVIDPATASITGHVVTIDTARARLGVYAGAIQCLVAPCIDFSVHVNGEIFLEDDTGEFRRIDLTEIQVNSIVYVWTSAPSGGDSLPLPVEASRVVVRIPDFASRKTGR
jgi:hypothetical protein